MKEILACLCFTIFVSGCLPTKENPKYLLSSGSYTSRLKNEKNRVYLKVEEEEIKVFARDSSGNYNANAFTRLALTDTTAAPRSGYSFVKSSFDLDVISIPLKFRPAISNFPAQLNTTLNGGIFIGRRADVYRLTHRKNELGIFHPTLHHYGISFGLFTGIGSAVMNPSVTRNSISAEYDAVVIPIGINTLIGFNNLTFGAALGVDQMINHDRKFWIYRDKPWIGLTVGLNLN